MPEVDASMQTVIEAFRELGTQRPPAFDGIPAIPVLDVFAWAAAMGLDEEAARLLKDVIRIVDVRFLEAAAAKRRLATLT